MFSGLEGFTGAILAHFKIMACHIKPRELNLLEDLILI